MRKSYIANSVEALNLHNGKQTAIVVKIKLPKWCKRFELQGGRQKDPTCYSLVDLFENNAYDVNGEYLTLMDIAPYKIGQEVYVRETIVCNALAGAIYKAGGKVYAGKVLSEDEYIHIDDLDNSYRGFIPLCKEKHSRTRFKIVGCEVVRVQEPTTDMLLNLKCNGTLGFAPIWYEEYKDRMISKFGQSAWDNNDYIWYYKIENI